MGDWNGDGQDGVGLYDPHTSTFYLTNTLQNGFAEKTFGYGLPGAGWQPLVGDWNGDRAAGVGLYDPHNSMFYLTSTLVSGFAEYTFGYGLPDAGWQPLVGDFDGNHTAGVGLYDPSSSTFYLTDNLPAASPITWSNSAAPAAACSRCWAAGPRPSASNRPRCRPKPVRAPRSIPMRWISSTWPRWRPTSYGRSSTLDRPSVPGWKSGGSPPRKATIEEFLGRRPAGVLGGKALVGLGRQTLPLAAEEQFVADLAQLPDRGDRGTY